MARGNRGRHMRRWHRQDLSSQLPPPSLEYSMTVSDALVACGFNSGQLGSWDSKSLDLLPNIRSHKPTPRRHHTQWQVVSDEGLSKLPSLEDLLVDVASRSRRNCNMTKGTELWRENERTQFTSQEWVVWSKQILEGEQVFTRVLNMPVGFLRPEVSQSYSRHAADTIQRHLPDLGAHGLRQTHANANITPRGTRTEVHHDSQHHVSTAVGLNSRRNRPLKLWLLWPSTELRHLASCYGDTNAALACMDHGSFLVQMPGESVVVPPNSPHAVFALESCYLYGHTFSTREWVYDPSTVIVDVRAGDPVDRACSRRISQLRLGLCSSAKLRQACVDQFIETWALDAALFRSRDDSFEQLVALWATDMRDRGSCAWCAAAGEPGRSVQDSQEHARAHLESRALPTMSISCYTAYA